MALLVIILDSSSCFFYVDFALVAFKYLHGFICGKANLLRLSRDSWAALVAQVEKQHAPWRWHSWNASGAAHMHSLPADIWGLCLQILFNMSLEMQHSAAFIRRWSKWQGIDFFFSFCWWRPCGRTSFHFPLALYMSQCCCLWTMSGFSERVHRCIYLDPPGVSVCWWAIILRGRSLPIKNILYKTLW